MIRIPFAAILAAAFIAAPALAAEPPDPDSAFGRVLIQVETRFDPPPMPIQLEDGGETHIGAEPSAATVVVFWATWCGVCRREMPQLDALQAELGAEGVTVAPVSIDEGEGAMDKVRAYLDRGGLSNLPAMIDYSRLNFQLLGARGTPTAFILDGDGQVAAAIEGPAHWTSLEAIAYLRSVVAETSQPRPVAD